MSDDIDVSSCGGVAVDTASLDRAAQRLDAVADDLDDLGRRASGVAELLEAAAGVSGGAGVHRAGRAASDLGAATGRARTTAAALRDAARTYEIVELSNERDLALAAGDGPRAQAAAAQLALARQADPAAADRADDAMAAWEAGWGVETATSFRDPLLLADPITALVVGLLAPLVVRTAGGGLVPRGAVPTGPAPAVHLTAHPVTPRAPVVAPASLGAMLGRVPEGGPPGTPRVRVDRYDLPDGSREFAVFITGTQDFLGAGGDEAWDSRSNGQLYDGQDSASLEAVRAALEASGAEPGDALDIVGFSQGGMVASWLAQDSSYDVQSLVTAGSPVVADLPDGVAQVTFEHTDDLVAALQSATAVAGTDTVVVERTVDEAVGFQDLLVPAHRLGEYIHTAELFEQSGDPRAGALDAVLARLATATAVTATEYSAVRVR